MTPQNAANKKLKKEIYQYAVKELQFDDCRFTDPHLNGELKSYEEWLDEGLHGDMKYLEDHLKFKKDPGLLLKNVKTAVVVIKNYKNTEEKTLKQTEKIARYAVGKDYHLVIKEKLENLEKMITKFDASVKTYSGVDSRPIAERKLAVKAGLGFLGKNGLVIKPGQGSYFFIGVIFLDTEVESDPKLKWDCGSCRLCLDACPTQALLENFRMDATKCISYQTIEKKSPMTDQELTDSKGWVFGCDICQEVCPYNHSSPLTDWAEFHPQAGGGFEFFDALGRPEDAQIPKETPLYRSRKRLIPNLSRARALKS